MAYDLDFYTGLQRDIETLGYRRIVRQNFPPPIPTHSREAVYAHHNNYGSTGAGKTVALCYLAIEKYLLEAPRFGIDGFKILEIDVLGKGELACCFHAMDESHPLYNICQEVGLQPESYPIEVLRPLVFVRGQPDLIYKQPDIVKPFTLALSNIAVIEWNCLLPNGLSSGQSNLLTKALNELEDIETATIYDLYVKSQEIIEKGNVGYGTHIDQMKNTPAIPLTKAVFSGREAKGLLQKLEVIADTGLIQPFRWKGKRVPTNLDLGKVLTNQKTISVLYIPRYKDLPHLNIGIINYILNHIYHLKHPNNPNRITQPLCIAIPELRNLVPKHIPERSRYYIEPVKNTMLELNSSGAGIGISLIGDTQYFEQIDDEYRANVRSIFIFDLGEEAGEKIRELVKNRYVSNFKEITDNYHLSALKDIGTFIYLGHGSIRAEIRKNALVGFWYPRARGKEGETETNFYDLFKRVYPERMQDVGSLYGLILQINMDAQTRASERMQEILAETSQKRKPKLTPEQKHLEIELKVLKALSKVCEEKTYFEYAEITELLVPKLKKSGMQVRRYLKDLNEKGFLIIDASQGRKQKKVIVDREKILKILKEAEQNASS